MNLAVMKAKRMLILYAILRYGVYYKDRSVIWFYEECIYPVKVWEKIERMAI